jgi:hypothetical protein
MHLRVCFLHQSQDMHNSEQTIWGKMPEEYDQYPSHTDIEKHCGQKIIQDVDFSHITECATCN